MIRDIIPDDELSYPSSLYPVVISPLFGSWSHLLGSICGSYSCFVVASVIIEKFRQYSIRGWGYWRRGGLNFVLRIRWWDSTITGDKIRDGIHRVVCALVGEMLVFFVGVIKVIG